MKTLAARAELFHSDGQTNTTKITDAFRNFANAPKCFFFWIVYVFVCISEQRLFPYTALTDWFL